MSPYCRGQYRRVWLVLLKEIEKDMFLWRTQQREPDRFLNGWTRFMRSFNEINAFNILFWEDSPSCCWEGYCRLEVAKYDRYTFNIIRVRMRSAFPLENNGKVSMRSNHILIAFYDRYGYLAGGANAISFIRPIFCR